MRADTEAATTRSCSASSSIQRVASEYARAGLWPDALAALGRFVDAPAYSGGDPPVTDALVRLIRRLAASPAKERYADPPRLDHADQGPAASCGSSRRRAHATSPRTSSRGPRPSRSRKPLRTGERADDAVISTAAALIDAARQAGTLDKLADEARAAADQKVENAEALHALVELARGQGPKVVPRIEARLADLIKENEERANEKPKVVPTGPAPSRPAPRIGRRRPSPGATTSWPARRSAATTRRSAASACA